MSGAIRDGVRTRKSQRKGQASNPQISWLRLTAEMENESVWWTTKKDLLNACSEVSADDCDRKISKGHGSRQPRYHHVLRKPIIH